MSNVLKEKLRVCYYKKHCIMLMSFMISHWMNGKTVNRLKWIIVNRTSSNPRYCDGRANKELKLNWNWNLLVTDQVEIKYSILRLLFTYFKKFNFLVIILIYFGWFPHSTWVISTQLSKATKFSNATCSQIHPGCTLCT